MSLTGREYDNTYAERDGYVQGYVKALESRGKAIRRGWNAGGSVYWQSFDRGWNDAIDGKTPLFRP